MFLSMVLEKISLGLGQERLQFLHHLADSMFLSVDVGHAYHPNHGEKMDPTNHSILNQGFCIKEASSQSYATDSQAIAVIEQICRQEEIPYSKFFNRSDGSCGSTLGSIASSMVPVPTVDSRSMRAPCRTAICLTMASPRPVPPVALERDLSTR